MPDHIEQDMWEISSSSSTIGSKKGCSNIKNIYKLNTYTSKTYMIKEFQTCQMLIIKGMAIDQIANKKLCEELPISWHVCALQSPKTPSYSLDGPPRLSRYSGSFVQFHGGRKTRKTEKPLGGTMAGDDGWHWMLWFDCMSISMYQPRIKLCISPCLGELTSMFFHKTQTRVVQFPGCYQFRNLTGNTEEHVKIFHMNGWDLRI